MPSFPKTSNNAPAGSLPRRLFARVFVSEWQLKLVALTITFALWMGVTGLKTPTTARLKGVALILNVRSDMEVISAPVEFVDLLVSGDKRKVDLLNPRDLVVSLDLSSVQPGERAVQVTASNASVELPTGVRLETVEPGLIPVNLERILERQIPVKVETAGSVPAGFELYSALPEPSVVTVRGPESVVSGLESVGTEKVNVRGRQESFSENDVVLQTVSPKARLARNVVGVSVIIGEKRVEKVISVPVTVDGRKRTAVLTLYGPSAALSEIKAEDLAVTVAPGENGSPAISASVPQRFRVSVEIRKKSIR